MSELFSESKYYDSNLFGLADILASIKSLIKQTHYLSKEDQKQLIDCCLFAAKAHDGVKRSSGEPYACHPIKVAEILANEVRFGLVVLQAAVLHDVIEDTDFSKSEIADIFGDEVACLVDGVSKLEKDKNISPQELQARTFEKLVVSMEADPRVIMIKFADRMHNMQTLDALRPEKRRRIAQETLDVYVPIASRLGMFIFKTELEELAFRHIYPWRHRIVKRLDKDNPKRDKIAKSVEKTLSECFKEHDLQVSIRRRRRNLLNIYKKIERNRSKRKPLENASIPFIIITETNEDCYRALGYIHSLYQPVFKKLTDYIASPKVNGYRSIHTSVLTKERRVINFQIRTKQMHGVAESGIIALWREHNESNKNNENAVSLQGRPGDKFIRRWLGKMKDLSGFSDTPLEYYEAVKRDLIDFDIQVFTPKGEPIALPKGASVIDFSYYIHKEIGNHLSTAKVNGVEVSIDYKLSTGQTVELFTDPSVTPKGSWLKKIKTGRARTAIRHFLRSLPEKDLIKRGRKEIVRYLKKHNTHYQHLDSMLIEVAEKRFKINLDTLFKKVALYEITRSEVRKSLQQVTFKDSFFSNIRIKVYNEPGVLARVAKTMGNNKVNIQGIHLPDDMQTEEVTLIFKIHLDTVLQLEKIIDELKALKSVKSIQHEETTNETNYSH